MTVSNNNNFKDPYLPVADAKKNLRYAAMTCASFTNDASWIEPFKIRLFSAEQSDVQISNQLLEKRKYCFFDRNTGLKIAIGEGQHEVLIAFGAMGSAATEVAEEEKKAFLEKQKGLATSNLYGISVVPAYEEAANFVSEIQVHPYFRNKKIILVGQSLGGSLAQYAALKNALEAKCFNPIPLGRAHINALKQQKVSFENSNHLITIISSEGDYATDIPNSMIVKAVNLVATGPQLFGKKYPIPSAYKDLIENHSYFMGSLMKYIGYDIRTKASELHPNDIFCEETNDIQIDLKRTKQIIAWLYELRENLNNKQTNTVRTVLYFIKENEKQLFNYMCLQVWLANNGENFGDANYGERRIWDNSELLLKIKGAEGTLLDTLIHHFESLDQMLKLKNSLAVIREQASAIKKELFCIPYFSMVPIQMNQLIDACVDPSRTLSLQESSSLLSILENLERKLIDGKVSHEEKVKLLQELEANQQLLFLALLMVLRTEIQHKLDFPTLKNLVFANPSLLFQNQNESTLVKVIECLKCLNTIQQATNDLHACKKVLEKAFSHYPYSNTLESRDFQSLINLLNRFSEFFSIPLDHERLLKQFHENGRELGEMVSSTGL